jgi:hypothetical protein
MEMDNLDPKDWPLAAMTGTQAFALSVSEKLALQKYLAGGGTLIIDAAGGSRDFAESVERHVLPLVPNGIRAAIAPSLILEGPEPVTQVTYRRAYALSLGAAKNRPRIQTVSTPDRVLIVYSADDITAGLVGTNWHGIEGYAPDTAIRMMTNLLTHLGRAEALQGNATAETP